LTGSRGQYGRRPRPLGTDRLVSRKGWAPVRRISTLVIPGRTPDVKDKPKPPPKPQPGAAESREVARNALQQSMDRRW